MIKHLKIMKSIKEIVETCGGNVALSKECKVTPQAISIWIRKNEIPNWHIEKVMKIHDRKVKARS